MTSHRLKSAALAGLMVLLFGFATGHAATFTVSKVDDTNDSSCDADCSLNDSSCDADCSLREAVLAANLKPGLDEIILPAGTYILSLTGEIFEDSSLTGDLDITDDLNIHGNGPTLTRIDGNAIDRVFHIAPAGQEIFVSLTGMSIQNGATYEFPSTSAEAAGGGLLNRGTLFLTNSYVVDNLAAHIGTGGGLHNMGDATLHRCQIDRNASFQGGGIYNEGTLEVLSSTIATNTTALISGSSGGGIYNQGELSVSGSAVFDNSAAWASGGGIYNDSILALSNTTLDNNTAAYGGGLHNTFQATLSNVTITNNDAPNGQGGGIQNEGTVEIGNSLLAGNTATNFPSNCNSGNGITSAGFNLEDINSCSFHGPSDQFSTDPLIGARANYGGPTPTVGLNVASPAIDGGNPAGCSDLVDGTLLTIDQRAFPRPVEGDGDLLFDDEGNLVEICDIGAFEYASTQPTTTADLAVGIDGLAGPVLTGDTLTYQVTTVNNGPDQATGTRVTIDLDLDPASSFTVLATNTSQGACSATEPIICSLGTVQNGEATSITVRLIPQKVGTLVVTASASSNVVDDLPSNDVATVSTTVLSSESVVLSSPNGSEVLPSGSTFLIEWQAPADATLFKLFFSENNGESWKLIDTVEDAASYSWTVADVARTETDNLVGIVAFDTRGNKHSLDPSDATFTITPRPVGFMQPNGGGSYYEGDQVPIQWQAASAASAYRLLLSLDSGSSWSEIETVNDVTGYLWSVPEITADVATARIGIVALDAKGKKLSEDQSDADFSLLQAVTVTTPNGGESYQPGDTIPIQWAAVARAQRFKVYYSANGGKKWVFYDEVANQNSINLTVPTVNTTLTNCLIGVVAFDATGVKIAVDKSDNPFTILGPVTLLSPNGDESDPLSGDQSDADVSLLQDVTVTTPNGGGSYQPGDTLLIQWSAVAQAQRFKVYYSRNGGKKWVFYDEVVNQNSTTLTVPMIKTTLSNCLIGVVAFDAAGVKIATDKSDAPFTILGPVSLTSPNGGESYPYGEFTNIAWTINQTLSPGDKLRLEYSLDNGATWSTLKSLDPALLSYDWRAPPLSQADSGCRVRAILKDAAGRQLGWDSSDAAFTIMKAAGDPWNYFPFEQGSRWTYYVTETENGALVNTHSENVEITGTRLRLGILTTIFGSSTPGMSVDNYMYKDVTGITNYGNNNSADVFTAQMIPYDEGRFPMVVGESFVQVDKKGLDFGEDVDRDGRSDLIDVKSVITVESYKNTTVPAGAFLDCVVIRTNITATVTLSSTGQKATAVGLGRRWAAPGIGTVKNSMKTTVNFAGMRDVGNIKGKLTSYSIAPPPP